MVARTDLRSVFSNLSEKAAQANQWLNDSRTCDRNDRIGAVAVVQTNPSRMAALEWKADIQPARMSVVTDTGRSKALRTLESNVS